MPLKDLNPLSSLHEHECVSSVSLSGLLEISTVERGVVSLFGVKSTLFIAMNSKGRLYTTVSSPGEGHLRAAGGLTLTPLTTAHTQYRELRLLREGRRKGCERSPCRQGTLKSMLPLFHREASAWLVILPTPPARTFASKEAIVQRALGCGRMCVLT